MAKKTKRIVNIRLRQDQEERINAIVERSAILDTSTFVRIAVDWLGPFRPLNARAICQLHLVESKDELKNIRKLNVTHSQ